MESEKSNTQFVVLVGAVVLLAGFVWCAKVDLAIQAERDQFRRHWEQDAYQMCLKIRPRLNPCEVP